MKAIILCPGPSLARCAIAPVEPGDLAIAVNLAAIAYECDVWVAYDWETIEKLAPLVMGEPRVLTHRGSANVIASRSFFDCKRVMVLDPHPLPGLPERNLPEHWDLFSSTMSLVYAATNGAKEIHVYGCDLQGVENFDGTRAESNRSPQRWAHEARLLADVCQALSAHGVKIEFHRPPEQPAPPATSPDSAMADPATKETPAEPVEEHPHA